MSVEFYDQNAESFIQQTADVDMRALYDRFRRALPEGGSILDAGCGSGRDSLVFCQMGYQVVAFDASKKMVDAARLRASIPVYQMSFEDIRFDQKFDGIWACASLLHVPRKQLGKVLGSLSSLLKSDGFLYASFKYGDNEREKGGRYFNDLNEDLLRQQLAKVDSLQLFEVWLSADQRPERHEEKWINCLLSKA